MSPVAPYARVGLALFLVTGAVNAQAPLYPRYAEAAGMGAVAVSLAFAAYLVGLLPVLLRFGGLSDGWGRKPVVLLGLAAAALATAVVHAVPTLAVLIVARMLQGVGVALAMGPAAAWMAELGEPRRAAAVTAATSALGFGAGALLTSLLPANGLRPWSHLVLIAAIAAAAAGIAGLPETAGRRGAPASRGLSFPAGSVRPAVAIGVGWGVAGTVIAVGPSVLDGMGSSRLFGFTLMGMLVAGWLTQGIAVRLPGSVALAAGVVIQTLGVLGFAAGAAYGSFVGVSAAVAFGGVASHGLTYAGGLSRVSALAGDDRARAVAGFLASAYVGFSVVPLVVGAVGVTWGWTTALLGLAAAVACVGGAVVGFPERAPQAPAR